MKAAVCEKQVGAVFGLDLSLNHTGVAIANDHLIASFCIVPKKLRGVERLAYIRNEISMLFERHHPRCVGIEGYSFGSRGRAIYDIGELGGVIRLLCYDMHVPAIIVPPAVVKKFAVGKGNAPKVMMVQAQNTTYHTRFRVAENNEVDAMYLARIAMLFTDNKHSFAQYLSRQEIQDKCDTILYCM